MHEPGLVETKCSTCAGRTLSRSNGSILILNDSQRAVERVVCKALHRTIYTGAGGVLACTTTSVYGFSPLGCNISRA